MLSRPDLDFVAQLLPRPPIRVQLAGRARRGTSLTAIAAIPEVCVQNDECETRALCQSLRPAPKLPLSMA